MPHAHDFCAMHVESNPVPTKTNPLGVKGAGEAGCVGALPAVVNALVDALSEFGVTHIEMPATPERCGGRCRGNQLGRSRRLISTWSRRQIVVAGAARAADAGRIPCGRRLPTTSGRCVPVRPA